MNFVILPPTHSTGDMTLGTFTVAGRYGYISAKCTGQGPMKVAGLWTVPCKPAMGVDELGFDTAGERIHLAVRARPGTTWWLAVGEHIPRLVASRRTVLHRSGVGSKSLGTVHLRGTVRVVNSCTGRGQLRVFFSPGSPSETAWLPGNWTDCPEIRFVSTTPAPAGGSDLDVSVKAGRKTHWTLTISETIGAATSARR